MPDLSDGESVEMKGSGAKPYVLKNTGGVYSCTCPAWRNQSAAIERRTCKHLRKLRGDAAEEARVGGALPAAAGPGRRRRRGAGRPAAAARRDLGHGGRPVRLVDEREARRRARVLGRQAIPLPPRQPVPRPGVVRRRRCPTYPLDGELWLGRKQFQRTVSIVRRQDKTDLWQRDPLTWCSTPRPRRAGSRSASRSARRPGRPGRPKFARPHDHVVCRDLDHLRAELARVEAWAARA